MKRLRRLLLRFLPKEGWRRRRTLRIGCLPFSLGAVGAVLLLVVLIGSSRQSIFVTYTLEDRIESTLPVVLVTLIIFNLIGTWLLGVFSSRAGSRAARGQGQLVALRLRVARRWMLVPTATIVLLRVALVVTMGSMLFATVLATLDFDIYDSQLRDLMLRSWYGLPLVGVVGLHLLGGPLLRMRYSTALGAFGASTTTDPAARLSAAFAARALAGMVGILLIVWGVAGAGLLLATLNQPVSTLAPLFSAERAWPLAASRDIHFLQVTFSLLWLILLHMAVQVIGAVLLVRLTRRRLAGRPHSQAPKGWLQQIAEQT